MKSKYYRIYNELYLNPIESIVLPYSMKNHLAFLRMIQEAIDFNTSSPDLRPDAKYFLLINFYHLIVLPIFHQRELDNDSISVDVLEEYIRADIKTIIVASSEQLSPYNAEQISGHHILSTIDKVWDRLKTTEFEIWG